MNRFRSLCELVLKEHAQVFELMDDASVRPLLEEIKKSSRVFVYGLGREGLAAKTFAMRLKHLGKESYWLSDDTTPAIEAGDILFCIAGGGTNGLINHVVDKAKAAGALIAIFTCKKEEYLPSVADVVLYSPASCYHVTNTVRTEQLMGNLFEQHAMILFDIMVMMLSEEMQITPEEMEARHRNVE